jgi:type IV secretion system protein VirB1
MRLDRRRRTAGPVGVTVMVVALPAFLALALACAPGSDPNRLADYAQVESSRNALALNLNGPGGGEQHATTMEEAVAIASRLIAAGRSVDLGIMQLNSAHLGEPGMPATVAEAMEPCRNIAAGAAVLAAADRQSACIYNTGKPGCTNGYPARIAAATARRIGAPAPPAVLRRDATDPTQLTTEDVNLLAEARSRETSLLHTDN